MSFKGRQQANREILNALYEAVERWPDIRFGQLLSALDVTQTTAGEHGTVKPVDIFYDESTAILDRVANAQERFK